MDEARIWQVEDRRNKVILEYFQNIYIASTQQGEMDCLEGLEGQVCEEMNQLLNHAFNKEEVWKALH